MATNVKYVSVPSKTLAASINASAYAIQLSDILGWDNNALTSANFGDVLWCVLRDSSNKYMEIMQLDPTTIANSSVTVLKRGLDFSGGSTEITANKLTWIKNDTVVELGTNPPQLLAQAVNVSGNQTIADVKTFLSLPYCTAVPTQAGDLINKQYADSLAFGGNANYDQNIVNGTAGEALTTANIAYLKASDGKWYVADSATAAKSVGVQLGIVQAIVASGAACRILINGRDKTQTGLVAGSVYYLGVTGAISTTKGANVRLIGQTPNGSTTDLVVNLGSGDPNIVLVDGSRLYAADTGAANAYVVTLSPAITAADLKTGFRFTFKATNANTTASTVNVNAVGAKTIKKGSGFTDLASGDIAASMMVDVEYDGTNFIMLNPTANTPASVKFGGTGADGALVVTNGNTNIDCANAAVVVKNYTSISITGTGSITLINPNVSGTVVILKSQGDVILTSSATPMIDDSGMGAAGATGASCNAANSNGAGGTGGASFYFIGTGAGGGGAGSAGAAGTVSTSLNYAGLTSTSILPFPNVFVGAGGGSGGCTTSNPGVVSGGNGGRGGGALIIEVGGALNFTTANGISVAGKAGQSGVNTSGSNTCGAGGGGGGGGCFILLYNILTANSGTVTTAGGAGGAIVGTGVAGGFGGGGGGASATNNGLAGGYNNAACSGNTGGTGGAGYSIIGLNTR